MLLLDVDDVPDYTVNRREERVSAVGGHKTLSLVDRRHGPTSSCAGGAPLPEMKGVGVGSGPCLFLSTTAPFILGSRPPIC